MLAMTLVGWVLAFVVIGWPILFVVGLWCLLDLIRISGMVRQQNERLVARITHPGEPGRA